MDPQQPSQDSELKKNAVAVGKVGAFMVVAMILFFLFLLISMTVMLRNP